MEDLTTRFIWKHSKTKKNVRVNSQRAKLKPEKGGMGIMDINSFWMSAKIGWLRKFLQKDYNEDKKSNNLQNQKINIDANKKTETQDWLKMLVNELIKISGDLSLTPAKVITGWGTGNMRAYGLRLKKQILEECIHRSRRSGGRFLLHKPTLYGRNGNMEHTQK